MLIRESPALFNILKLVGAAYLVWLGAKMLFSRKADGPVATNETAISDFGALRVGFLTNALNPKTTIFIVSLFMQVVQVNTPLATRIAYGLFISLARVVWFAAVGLFFGAPRIQKRIFGVRHWIDRTFGLLLVGFGIALAAANIGS